MTWPFTGEKQNEVESLRETVNSLELQLMSLYREREDGNFVALPTLGGAPSPVAEINTAREAIENLEAQLREFYSAQQNAAGKSTEELQDTVRNMEQQLIALYAERTSGSGANDETVANLEAQLVALYQEKQMGGWASNSSPTVDLHETIMNLEAQLSSLYAERTHDVDANGMVESMEQQIIALLDEKSSISDELHTVRGKMRRIGSVILDVATE